MVFSFSLPFIAAGQGQDQHTSLNKHLSLLLAFHACLASAFVVLPLSKVGWLVQAA